MIDEYTCGGDDNGLWDGLIVNPCGDTFGGDLDDGPPPSRIRGALVCPACAPVVAYQIDAMPADKDTAREVALCAASDAAAETIRWIRLARALHDNKACVKCVTCKMLEAAETGADELACYRYR